MNQAIKARPKLRYGGCPFCGGAQYWDEEYKCWKCMMCSKPETWKPPPVIEDKLVGPKKMTKPKKIQKEAQMVEQKTGKRVDAHERHRYIEEHKAEIIDAYLAGGAVAVKAQFGVSPGGWHTIQKRWAADIEARRLGGDKGQPEKELITEVGMDYKFKYMEMKAWSDGYRQCVLDIDSRKSDNEG